MSTCRLELPIFFTLSSSHKHVGRDLMRREGERIRTYFEPLMGKVSLNEKYCIKDYFDFTILKSDIEFIWNDHNPKNILWTLRFLFSDRVTHIYIYICIYIYVLYIYTYIYIYIYKYGKIRGVKYDMILRFIELNIRNSLFIQAIMKIIILGSLFFYIISKYNELSINCITLLYHYA